MGNPFKAAVDLTSRRAYATGGTAYAGAAGSRLTNDWILATTQSGDQEIRGDLRKLKERSRELVRNNDTATRYVSLLDEQAIGPDGIRLQSQVKRANGMLDLDICQRIEDAWLEWCEVGTCTVDGGMAWNDVLSDWAHTTPQDGEWLVRMLPFRGNRFGFALDILDTDVLDPDYNRAPGEGGNEIRMGVEIDRFKKPVAYHVWNHHPSEYSTRGRDRLELPASQVVHYYRRKRGAVRGVPWFAPALLKLRHIAGYEEAEVIAARIAAAKGGFFTQSAESVMDPNSPNAGEQNAISFEIEPGRFDRLPPGWDFKEWDPKHPTAVFADFHKAMMRGVANGLGVSHVTLSNDLSEVNFSSIRAGLLNERDAWRRLQRSLIRHFCTRVFRAWLAQSLKVGALQLPERNRERWANHRFQPRGYPWVDPLKDIEAGLLEVGAGLTSLSRLAAERGHDFEEILAERATETELAKAFGVEIDLNQKPKPEPAAEDGAAQARTPEVAHRLIGTRAAATNRIAGLLNGNGNGKHA